MVAPIYKAFFKIYLYFIIVTEEEKTRKSCSKLFRLYFDVPRTIIAVRVYLMWRFFYLRELFSLELYADRKFIYY
jgi:hypothetical protein